MSDRGFCKLNGAMMKNVERLMRRCRSISTLLVMCFLCNTTAFAQVHPIKVVKEEVAKEQLNKQAKKDLVIEGDIESSQIVKVILNNIDWFYLVPVKVNGD